MHFVGADANDRAVLLMELFNLDVEAATTDKTVPCLIEERCCCKLGARNFGDRVEEEAMDDDDCIPHDPGGIEPGEEKERANVREHSQHFGVI